MRPISYSSFNVWRRSHEEWVVRYLTEKPKELQTQPMALGSGFDAYVKKAMGCPVDYYERRDDVHEDVERVFKEYREAGCIRHLYKEARGALVPPVFEHDLTFEVDGVMLRGKPDMFFVNSDGVRYVFDWKVNGYYSQASPKAGYVWRRSTGLPHKDTIVVGGLSVDPMKGEWADQMSFYSWLTGGAVGEEFVAGIEQVTHRNGKLDFTRHRAWVKRDYQQALFNEVRSMWDYIADGYYFPELSRAESDRKTELLTSDEGWLYS